MIQLKAVFRCFHGVVVSIGSCADALQEGFFFNNHPVVGITRIHSEMYWDDFGLKCRELDCKYVMGCYPCW
jgi:hypothetical protein